MKKIFFLIAFLPSTCLIYSDENPSGGELIIYNRHATDNIKVVVYPIAAVFNGNLEYSLKCFRPLQGVYSHIVGGQESEIMNNSSFALDHDGATDNEAEAAIGYGKYRVEIYKKVSGNYQFVDYVDVDYGDADYPALYSVAPFIRDLPINYYSSTDIRYWNGTPIPSSRYIPIWDQSVRNQLAVKTQNKNGFKTTNSDNGEWLDFPLYAPSYGGAGHLTPELCGLNLNIEPNHTAYVKCPESFTIDKGAKLTLTTNSGSNAQFIIGDDPNSTNCGATFTVSGNTSPNLPFGWLYLQSNTTVDVIKKSMLRLEYN
ncbi:MAG: hypothetical protein L0Y79_11910, partial [Chlorobi bacterium]|nr:hypothetical protein [Chlorobiota bacterium]MCI0716122.1 hypothetical protein [Chlorobiota bacterium]